MPKRPTCHIIAGPNGTGKTTFAKEFLPHYAKCLEFVNPDLIAQGLSPFDPVRQAAQAGRLVLNRIGELTRRRMDFAMETTLSGRTYVRMFRSMLERGYRLNMYYVWLPSPELALLRIEDRARHGGHDVPDADVRRRFARSIRNLFREYLCLMDSVFVFDNSGDEPEPIWMMEKSVHTSLNAQKAAEFLKAGKP